MTTFASYCLANIIKSAGWPHKGGLFSGGPVVDLKVVDLAAKQVVQIGVCLACTDAQMGANLIADAFRDRDWQAQPFEELIDLLGLERRMASHPDSPLEALLDPGMVEWGASTGRKSIPWDWLWKPEFAFHNVGAFASGLVWGFTNPDLANQTLRTEFQTLEQIAVPMKKAGLLINESPTFQRFRNSCQEIVNAFVTEIRPIAPSPASLLASPLVRQRLQGSR